MKEIQFKGKVAVITGAASGMGLYCSKEFVRLGAKVIMCDVNEQALAAAAEEIGEAAVPVAGDVREYSYAETVAVEAAKHGGADYLIACAGGYEARCCNSMVPFYEQPKEVIDWGIDVNLKGPVYFSRTLMPQMVAKKSGVLVMLGSVTGFEGDGTGAMYGTAKSGLFNFVKGLAMAGLNFVGYAHYREPASNRDNIASFELIPWILAQCASVKEAAERIEKINLTNTPFHAELPPSQLHWIIADSTETITVESVKEGIRIFPNPVGILTNNPPFDQQLLRLQDYMHLSPKAPHNHFSEKLALHPYSLGMGALGLPGDVSSQSRFVRAAFVKMNSVSGAGEGKSVSQFFHILGSVDQVRGCCEVEDGKYETTVYTSCCNTDKGIYYYTTYDNHQISAVNMHREKLDDGFLIRYPLACEEQICFRN